MASLALPLPRLPRARRPRIALLLAPAAIALLLGGWLWFRDSSFASVQSVQISGVSGPGAAEIETALRRSARQMSTLDVNVGALQAAVASYPQVRALDVHASFPHGLRIAVIERPAVAVLQAASGRRAAAAADGVLLGGTLAASDLPTIPVSSLPTKRVHDPLLVQYLQVLGAAPAPLERLVWRVYDDQKGVTVEMRDGMLVIFGDSSRAHAKWLSLASVIVANGTASAAYVDVRAPERPAISATAAGATTATGSASGAAPAQGSLGTAAAIAASLEATINGQGSPPSSTAAAPSSTAAAPSGAATPSGESGSQEAQQGATGQGAPTGASTQETAPGSGEGSPAHSSEPAAAGAPAGSASGPQAGAGGG
jgi:cell division septal protein FtsQ